MSIIELFDEYLQMRIVGGDKYSHQCYGPYARFLDLEDNVCVVFDVEDGTLYEISLIDPETGDEEYIWRHEDYIKAFEDELKADRAYSNDMIEDRRNNTELYTIICRIHERFKESDLQRKGN